MKGKKGKGFDTRENAEHGTNIFLLPHWLDLHDLKKILRHWLRLASFLFFLQVGSFADPILIQKQKLSADVL